MGEFSAAPQRVHDLVRGVPGWLREAEGNLLFNLARRCREGCIVEIGSYAGKSTTFLAAGSESGARVTVHAIDPHVDEQTGANRFPVFQRQIERVGFTQIVQPTVSRAADAAAGFHEPIELLFIDGAHDLASVMLDWDLWTPKLIPGGYVAMHDSLSCPGPKQVAEAGILRSDAFFQVGLVDSITYGRKCRNDEDRQSHSRNRMLVLKRVANFAVRLPLPASARTVGSRVMRALQGK